MTTEPILSDGSNTYRDIILSEVDKTLAAGGLIGTLAARI